MKRAIMLAIFAMFVIAVAASADTALVTLATGNNLIAASLVPYDPAPSTVFKTDTGNPITISSGNRLSRWDPAISGFRYYGAGPLATAFGKVLLGAGYFLRCDNATYWSYVGVPNGVPDSSNKKTDMWISLPIAGSNMIGHPFTDAVTWGNCLMTDGNVTVSVATAKNAPYTWWSGNLRYWNPGISGFSNVVIAPTPGTKTLTGYTGYYLQTNVPNLALIVPANTP